MVAAVSNLIAMTSFNVKRKASLRVPTLATEVLFKCNGGLMWLCVVSIFLDVLSESITTSSISSNFLERRSSSGALC